MINSHALAVIVFLIAFAGDAFAWVSIISRPYAGPVLHSGPSFPDTTFFLTASVTRDTLFDTPVMNNHAFYERAQTARSDLISREMVRVVEWNIEGGQKLNWIKIAFTDPQTFLAQLPPESQNKKSRIAEQLNVLQNVDIFILNEADIASARSGYVNTVAELAETLNMNYAFGTEFIQFPSPKYEPSPSIQTVEYQPAPQQQYPEIQGNAVLSTYPVVSARIHKLTPCYDWYEQERRAVSAIDRIKQTLANEFFQETSTQQIRYGNRIALIVELAVPGPEGGITVVAAHLENKTSASCRRQQLIDILQEIKDVDHPVILAGDFNTSGRDDTPTSITREVTKRVKSPAFWAKFVLFRMADFTVSKIAAAPLNYFRKHLDPTVKNIPLISENPESGFFTTLKDFRFNDGRRFDFGGSQTLANSNERRWKGFTPTYSTAKDYQDMLGSFKLDWIFVKPSKSGTVMSPRNPRSLQLMNQSVKGRISDHNPITVDLSLR